MSVAAASESAAEILPEEERASLGLSPSDLAAAELVQAREDRYVWRVRLGGTPQILKWSPKDGHHEIRCYALLGRLGVPTLTVHATGRAALLIEDLAHSLAWRPAAEGDATRAETGRAVARWYRALHAAGEVAATAPYGPLDWLPREVDALTPPAIRSLGERLGLADLRYWSVAAEHVEQLKTAMAQLPQTLTYNDFHWSNLALSRDAPPRAVVFDYHLVGRGVRYSDYRNVMGSLGMQAASAFADAYGRYDTREKVLDDALAELHALWHASRLQRLPRWAHAIIRHVRDGTLEHRLIAALALLNDH